MADDDTAVPLAEPAAEELVSQTFEVLSIIESVPDLILITDDTHTVLFANEWAARMLDAGSPERLLGKTIDELVCTSPNAAEQHLARGEYSELALPTEVRFRKPNREVATVSLCLARRIEFGGGPCMLLVGRDVTEERNLQKRLERSERLASIGTLAAGVAHEINNPLAFVGMNLDFIADEVATLAAGQPVAAELKEALTQSAEGVKRIATIVRDLKTFSRDQEEASPTEIVSAVDRALKMVEVQLRHKCQLIRALGPAPQVMGNDGRFAQVVINLVSNAAQAMPEGRELGNWVKVSTRTDPNGNAVLEVSDNGVGIPKETLHRIFDPFFTTKPVGQGTGLGLSVTHAIVTAAGGHIDVESQVGAGTTMRVIVPPAKLRLVMPPAPPPVNKTTDRKKRVLVIDDEKSIGVGVRRMLSGDHDVKVLEDPREALDLLKKGEMFDAVICDLMMPGLNGMSLHAAIRQHAPDLSKRFVFMTGGVFSNEARQFLETTTNPKLDKPFTREAVLSAVESLGAMR